jgi:hypothetical protein
MDDDHVLKMQEKVGKNVTVVDRESLRKQGITELQFWANPDKFTVGSELYGEAEIRELEPLKSKDPSGAVNADGSPVLVDRILVDALGAPIVDAKTKEEIVCKRATIQFKSLQCHRAIPIEEITVMSGAPLV